MRTIKVDNIDSYYGSLKVLENINLQADKGEFIGIVGPNGSGKSTLLKSVGRVLKPRVGTVLLEGKDIYTMKSLEVARGLAGVPQETPTSFEFSAFEVVLMGRIPHLGKLKMESPQDLRIAEKAMKLTKTWHLAKRPINELSGGEKRRVIISRALAQEPRVLLLDEPTAHLDISHQIEIMDLTKELVTKEGMIVIMAIHDLNLASRYCKKIVLLSRGKIISIGSPEEVLITENIKKVYGINALVKRHPITDHLYILIPHVRSTKSVKATVHLVCGGGSGVHLMHLLLNQGFEVTAGVVNVLDTDYEVAQHLNIQTVSEAPFSSITEEAHQTNLKLIKQADVVVLTGVPFGYGNLKNMEAVVEAAKVKPVLLIEDTPIDKRDFTKGEATKLYGYLKTEGTTTIRSQDEILPTIERMMQRKAKDASERCVSNAKLFGDMAEKS